MYKEKSVSVDNAVWDVSFGWMTGHDGDRLFSLKSSMSLKYRW